MERVQRIYMHPLYQRELKEIKDKERERIYCKHDESHFLAVARLMYISCLENKAALPKALIYAAAFLHDIGRAAQYRESVPHEEASVRLAAQLMPECGFTDEETQLVCMLIAVHRDRRSEADTNINAAAAVNPKAYFNADADMEAVAAEVTERKALALLFYKADKQSRNCFCCEAAGACNWAMARRTLRIEE